MIHRQALPTRAPTSIRERVDLTQEEDSTMANDWIAVDDGLYPFAWDLGECRSGTALSSSGSSRYASRRYALRSAFAALCILAGAACAMPFVAHAVAWLGQ